MDEPRLPKYIGVYRELTIVWCHVALTISFVPVTCRSSTTSAYPPSPAQSRSQSVVTLRASAMSTSASEKLLSGVAFGIVGLTLYELRGHPGCGSLDEVSRTVRLHVACAATGSRQLHHSIGGVLAQTIRARVRRQHECVGNNGSADTGPSRAPTLCPEHRRRAEAAENRRGDSVFLRC